jgi:hypothetical protein
MRAPAGEKAALHTRSSCPRRTLISVPVVASQIRAVLSPEPVTMRAPSGEKAALGTTSSWRRTLISVPVAASQIRTGNGDDAGTVGGEGGAAHQIVVPTENFDFRLRRRVPDPCRVITGTGDDAGTVGGEGGAQHNVLVAKNFDLGPCCRVPDPCRAIAGTGDDAGTVGGEGGAAHQVVVPKQAEPLRSWGCETWPAWGRTKIRVRLSGGDRSGVCVRDAAEPAE